MQEAFLVLCTLMVITSATEKECSQIKAMNKLSTSIGGRWFLVAAKNREPNGETMTQSRMSSCGGKNNITPCSCSGIDLVGSSSNAYGSYNITNFSYNMTSEKYNYMQFSMNPINSTEVRFNLIPRANGGDSAILKGLASDEERTFMFVLICSPDDDEIDMWFFSRTPMATDMSIKEVSRVLEDNNLSIDQLFMVDQSNCEYPPMAGAARTKDRKLWIF